MDIFKIFKKKRCITLETGKSGLVGRIPVAMRARGRKKDFYLAVAVIMKDEGPYLEEWIEFHRLVGFEHFILYDNDSTDDTVEILQKYIKSNIVTLIPWPNFCTTHSIQMLAYSHALSLMAGRTRWLCFIDLDEFLFPTETDDLRDALVEFESEPAVGVYWSLFGTSGLKSKPQGLVIENYTWRMPYPMERHTTPSQERLLKKMNLLRFKSIVQPTRVISTKGSHAFITDRFPVIAVDGSWNEMRPHKKRFLFAEKFQLNHYISKSQEEWNSRLERRTVKGADKSKQKQRMLDAIETDPIEDTEILKYLPKLKYKVSV